MSKGYPKGFPTAFLCTERLRQGEWLVSFSASHPQDHCSLNLISFSVEWLMPLNITVVRNSELELKQGIPERARRDISVE